HVRRVVAREHWTVDEGVEMLRVGYFDIGQLALRAFDLLVEPVVRPRVEIHRYLGVRSTVDDDRRLAAQVARAKRLANPALHALRECIGTDPQVAPAKTGIDVVVLHTRRGRCRD